MNCPASNSGLISLPSLLFFHLALSTLVILSGCAQKPWGDSFDEQQEQVYRQLFEDMRQQEKHCAACMDGDVKLFITSPVGNRAAAGYFQLMQPAHARFIASNPFGQPLLLFVSDGETFQYINTADRLSLAGDVTVFFQTLDAPPSIVSTSWGQWLTGRLPVSGTVETIRKDGDSRGVWITVTSFDTPEKKEHLLIDIEDRNLLGRILSSKGKILLRVDYNRPPRAEDGNGCIQPDVIHLTGLDYGTELTLRISNHGELPGCRSTDFVLPVPPGYLHREIGEEGH